MTQQDLADATSPTLSVNMVGRIETGKTGVSFNTIVNLASALGVDEAEFFTLELPKGALQRSKLQTVTVRLARLSDEDLDWVARLIDTALNR